MRWRRPGTLADNPTDLRLGEEVARWLAGFDWGNAIQRPRPRIADIGAKNFFLAPALDSLFRARGFDPEIHGVELDAFRRYHNLWTRADYGFHYAARIPRGTFHPVDFLSWRQPLDIALLLNPFVTESPLIAWGLPRKHFQPEKIFAHAYALLKLNNGVLCVCSPEEAELEKALRFAEGAGFRLRQRHDWLPSESDLQKRRRLGALLVIAG